MSPKLRNISGLHFVRSHEDEPAWGHFLRAKLTGGSQSARDLPKKDRNRTTILQFLASCDGVTVHDYAALHGESLLVGSMARWNGSWWSQIGSIGFPLLAGGRGARRDIPPRACQLCVRESATKYGYAWFQRAHNVAGVASCHKHGERLFIAGSAEERSKFSASLGQLEFRSRDPTEFAYVDHFVRRYELAVLMLLQCADRRERWPALIDLFQKRMKSIGLKLDPQEIADFVRRRSNPEWLQWTFMDQPGHTGTLQTVLSKAFDQPVYTPHHALLLAAAFDDISELSTTLSTHSFGKPVEPLLRAAHCN